MLTALKEAGIKIGRFTSGQIKVKCPSCSHKAKHKNKTDLSVNISEGKWFCHNPGCNFVGGVGETEAADEFDWSSDGVELPDYNPDDYPLTNEVVDWFLEQGISEDSLEINQIGSGENEHGRFITFPYFVNGEVVRVKYRMLEEKRFWQSTGLKTFYGLDSLIDENGSFKPGAKSLLIVEGEKDVLALHTAGIMNVISVPDGAPDPSKAKNLSRKFDYLDDDRIVALFEQAEEVVLATDSDEPGQFLADELARRIGYRKAWRVQFPEDTKDASDVLRLFGPEKLIAVVDAKRRFPVEGTYEVTDFRRDIRRLYEDGAQPGLSSGWEGFDKIATFEFGRLNIITGAPNSGKSEWLDSLNIQMAQLHDLRVGYFSPESYPPEKHFKRLAQKVTGKRFGKPGDYDRMTLEELDYAERWIQDKVKWIHPKAPTPERVIEASQKLILRDGIKILTLDPWNNMLHQPGSEPMHQYISNALNMFREFAREYRLILNLVVHPRKLLKRQGSTCYECATAYDLKDASEWFDKADNIFSVCLCRPDPVEIHIEKGKDAEIVRPGAIGLFNYEWRNTSYQWINNEGFYTED